MSSLIVRDGGPPRLCSPLPDSATAASNAADPAFDRALLPMMVYLPGIDGTGLAAARQFPGLLRNFDLCTLITPPADRTDFQGTVDVVAAYLQAEVPLHPPTRPVYLLGESFGGVLALAVAAACPALVDRLVLVNPATSFAESLWPLLGPLLPQVPVELYRGLPLALAPVLGNPVNLLAAALDGAGNDATVAERAALVARGAAQLLSQLPVLADLLPRETLAFKLRLLQQGCAAVAPLLGCIPQRVLLLVGAQDLLIPSGEEGGRLARALPRAHLRVEAGRSHALLQEGGVDLVAIMEAEGALVRRRAMSAPPKKRTAAAFGSAEPIELPTAVELRRSGERATALGRRLTSPVFVSTSASGVEALGLGNLPAPGAGPVLYVGNHQTLALDLGVLCEQFLEERQIMLRGLAHPVIFANSMSAVSDGSGNSSDGDGGSTGSQRSGSGGLSPFDLIPAIGEFWGRRGQGQGRAGGAVDGRQSFAAFMMEFGAVPVSARNLMRLLQNGESVLLFPGGVREAYKRKGEDYQLFWPQRSEFVRMAARHGATIVPFAAVGVDDSLEIVLDSDELRRAPLVGPMVAAQASRLPQARRGVAASDPTTAGEESFVSPLALPRLPPRRMYFYFQRPIATTPDDLKDRARCDEIYRGVKAAVESGLAGLKTRREADPFGDFGTRLLYESVRRGKQAPTFPLL